MINSENIIIKLTLEFALRIISYCETLDGLKKLKISEQLIKSGTSIGANSNEAQNSESTADFIHKFKIAAKEANETEYWLNLCQFSKSLPDCTDLINDLAQIQRIINQIITTTKNKSKAYAN